MYNFTCFASIYDEVEEVRRNLMFDPLDFKRTIRAVVHGKTLKAAMQKFVFTNEFSQFMDKYERTNLYYLKENGEILTFQEMIDI